jgi:hypothetical protein
MFIKTPICNIAFVMEFSPFFLWMAYRVLVPALKEPLSIQIIINAIVKTPKFVRLIGSLVLMNALEDP